MLSVNSNCDFCLPFDNHLPCALEPDHIRAQNNKFYFEKAIREQEALHGAPPPAEVDVIVNERPRDTYQSSDFFKNYEALCRGEKTHVRVGNEERTREKL